VLICPLPLFHVFAAYPILMAAIASGAHVVFPTPQGYRGDGVFDNFWKLIERWQVTFLITVPTAIAALMQRPVNADVSSLKTAISGSAPLPVEFTTASRPQPGWKSPKAMG
jgi:fatty-acyl-CoA synthase